jgi:hypothetical protein
LDATKGKAALVTVLAAMLAVTSCLADQLSDYIKTCRESPTEDFSRLYTDEAQRSLANADAIAYFQDHSDLEKCIKEDRYLCHKIGYAHALAHHILGDKAGLYATDFEYTIQAIIAAKEMK